MNDNFSAQPGGQNVIDLACPLAAFATLVESLFSESQAAARGLSLERFQRALEIGIRKRFVSMPPTPATLKEYLATLHVEDLALACACAEGLEPAWEQFVANYRHYLYSAAAAIIRRPSDDPYVREFADSVYATLYGKDTALGRSSLFEHFHGRSKLTTWLRAVLAQRYVDVIRREKKFDSLDDGQFPQSENIPGVKQAAEPEDPHRSHYLRCLADALHQAVAALASPDRARLYSYYFEERTLAEIAKEAQEHEATASRKLERLRRDLKQRVTQILREGTTSQNGRTAHPGMDDAQIQLCFEYAVEEWPFDLAGLLRSMKVSRTPGSKAPEQDD
jgi:RNA polymerase sigma factor (sigma-70 family)